MADLTMEQIAELRRLDNKAHDGPWSYWPDYGIRPAPKYGRGTQLSFDGQEEMDANHALVIAMRNALPALLDMAERCAKAEAELAKLTCKCSLRTRLVGDGCDICNPEDIA